MASWVSDHLIEPWQIIAEQQSAQNLAGQYGATASFIGSMRDFSDRTDIKKMVLEHYPAMTSRYLEKLEDMARQKWPLLDCLIVHRVGEVHPGDAIVVIACWSAHRRAALDACDWLIEELKYKAPFWKKEFTNEGGHWVTGNTDGH
ncbi:molybdopterin synthase catalytic subunit [Methylophaga thalassica]|jgi:molybdopterin synthase catalytic subunit|uniref:Molybdopterin synthase catalytic subunit n=1 Tax=Methylophaga thalassica TaxID=40223 RepID=A0ABQ5TVX7_9GAMM|nr:molybdenum cofactor biosynthesis protein MoaE [Methylophaga thalassica]GLQ00135.1 molybdopterin synthase catalytic subunit [Methylophaga thalassica]